MISDADPCELLPPGLSSSPAPSVRSSQATLFVISKAPSGPIRLTPLASRLALTRATISVWSIGGASWKRPDSFPRLQSKEESTAFLPVVVHGISLLNEVG